MKIGTVTYHRADNYGAVLQAYALRQYLHEQGFDVENIDYWPHHHAIVYKIWCWSKYEFHSRRWKGKLLYFLLFPLVLLRSFKRKRNFDKFRKQKMKIVPIGQFYDAVFYGSDTIWNKWNLNGFFSGFDSTYWGGGLINAKHRFSYAPSMGNVIDSAETNIQCKTYLPKFDKISVREIQLKSKLEEWGFKNIQITLDPTMLLTKKSWDALANNRIVPNNYVLCYNLENSSVCGKLAENVGRECKLPVIQLTALVSQKHSNHIYDTAGPFEFLSLFRYASYVVTSSFHGCVFSIIYNRIFCFHSDVETERITNLLESCGLKERFVTTTETAAMYQPIDYNNVNKQVEKMALFSKCFIKECIQMVESNNERNL